MLKNKIMAAAIGLMTMLPMAASASTFVFSNGGGNGSGTDLGPIGGFEFGLALTSNNNGTPGLFTTFTNVAATAEIISGAWNYATFDIDGSSFDKLGYFIDNVFTTLVQLSTDGIPAPAFQNGLFSFNVAAGHSYGFYMLATDGILGSSNGTIFGNTDVAPVPLPAGGLLLIGAMGGLTVLRRRKSL